MNIYIYILYIHAIMYIFYCVYTYIYMYIISYNIHSSVGIKTHRGGPFFYSTPAAAPRMRTGRMSTGDEPPKVELIGVHSSPIVFYFYTMCIYTIIIILLL